MFNLTLVDGQIQKWTNTHLLVQNIKKFIYRKIFFKSQSKPVKKRIGKMDCGLAGSLNIFQGFIRKKWRSGVLTDTLLRLIGMLLQII